MKRFVEYYSPIPIMGITLTDYEVHFMAKGAQGKGEGLNGGKKHIKDRLYERDGLGL